MNDIQITRDFAVSPARLFEAITTKAEVIQWWGHDGMTVPDHALDFTQTGPWHAVMIGAEGGRFHMSGQITHVRAPASVGFTWGWHDDDGVRGAESHVTLTVTACAKGARLTIDHVDLPSPEVAARHEAGWGGPMARLDRLLSRF